MNVPESIVVSLDWAKDLQETGWPFENAMFYRCLSGGNSRGYSGREVVRYAGPYYGNHGGLKQWIEPVAAPTAEEILRVLPRHLPGPDNLRVTLAITPYADKWTVEYLLPNGGYYNYVPAMTYNTLANAAAAMYCHLASSSLL